VIVFARAMGFHESCLLQHPTSEAIVLLTVSSLDELQDELIKQINVLSCVEIIVLNFSIGMYA